MSILAQVKDAFRRNFDVDPAEVVRAPGRVNLIGEHTDYNDGFVLPCAIDFGTYVAIRNRPDRIVNLIALDYHEQCSSFMVQPSIAPDVDAPWANYVRGVFQVLLDRGVVLPGVDMVIAGDVPQGAGLSSSAALEVATALALDRAGGLGLTPTDWALIAQQAENEFVGCQCGIMDQLASATGQEGHATLIDCRSLEVTPVALPADASIVIINSNVRRGLVDSEYNARRAECEAAAEILGVEALRDADMTELETLKDALSETEYRRARHVIGENQRTLDAVKALAEGDLGRMGQLMAASHASLRDDFEVTVPPIDRLVSIVETVVGETGGVRMTGGGFGGCVVALVPPDLVEPIRCAVNTHYSLDTGLKADVYVCCAMEGAGLVTD